MQGKIIPGLGFVLVLSALSPGRAQDLAQSSRDVSLPQWLHRLARYVDVIEVDDGSGSSVPTIRITGANLQIVNGQGSSSTSNGRGNLILGYNELGNPDGDVRSGSHCLVLGIRGNYQGWMNFVGGSDNSVAGGNCAVFAGTGNRVDTVGAVIATGTGCSADSAFSFIGTGQSNQVSGVYGACLGGGDGQVDGNLGVVVGGFSNVSVGGGSVVSGGINRVAPGSGDWVAGALFQDQ